MTEPLQMWTVYWNPRDYPNLYVARLFHNDQPQSEHFTSTSLEAIRTRMRAKALAQITRSELDEPQIVECWL